MIDITENKGNCCNYKCVAGEWVCNALSGIITDDSGCTPRLCGFYKPRGCSEMIRRDTDDAVLMLAPEEIMNKKELKAYYKAKARGGN